MYKIENLIPSNIEVMVNNKKKEFRINEISIDKISKDFKKGYVVLTICGSNHNWIFVGCYKTKKDAEKKLILNGGEIEYIRFYVIKVDDVLWEKSKPVFIGFKVPLFNYNLYQRKEWIID